MAAIEQRRYVRVVGQQWPDAAYRDEAEVGVAAHFIVRRLKSFAAFDIAGGNQLNAEAQQPL